MLGLWSLLFFAALCLAWSSDVVVLDSKNFEQLTQASTGGTTGDWLIKFYAPWCGHCKKLVPVYEEVASELAGEINVAKVDVTGSRDLGTRFEIKGFPTMKLLSKGKVYTYKGPRTVKDIVEFVRGGYQIQSAEDVQPPLGFLGEISYVFRHAYKMASADLRAGKIFSVNVFLTFMPILFIVLVLLLIFAPAPSAPKKRRAQSEGDSQSATGDAPSTAEEENDKTD